MLAAGSSLRGIACMLVSGVFLTTTDSITKWLVPHYPAGEILALQGSTIALLVACWMGLRGENPIAIRAWRLHLYRGLMYASGSFAFVYALKYLPLAEVIAITFAGPLFMLRKAVGVQQTDGQAVKTLLAQCLQLLAQQRFVQGDLVNRCRLGGKDEVLRAAELHKRLGLFGSGWRKLLVRVGQQRFKQCGWQQVMNQTETLFTPLCDLRAA